MFYRKEYAFDFEEGSSFSNFLSFDVDMGNPAHFGQVSRGAAFPTRLRAHPAKGSACTYPYSLIRVFTGHPGGGRGGVPKDPVCLRVDSEDSDQLARMCRLI